MYGSLLISSECLQGPIVWDGIFSYPKLGDSTDSDTQVKGHSQGVGSYIQGRALTFPCLIYRAEFLHSPV